MKKRWKFVLLMIFPVLAHTFQLNNTSNAPFIGNNLLDITLKGGQVAEMKGPLVNGAVYGYLDMESMNSNECYFEAGTGKFDWDTVTVFVQYAFNIGCTVGEPRLCCIEMPDEF